MQINITGFLQSKNAREFMKELWTLLVSAQENIGGIPSSLLEKKKEEIKQRKVCAFSECVVFGINTVSHFNCTFHKAKPGFIGDKSLIF